ncbi:MAG TPA: single-stranded DNA-binding protein, partial [Roseiflexaceae bacterium]|nr:single-stranded DNA-binding protein [Roseiflexaceae bacterium]
QTRKWQDKEGQDRYTSEVIASDMIILSSRQDRPSSDYEAPAEEETSAPPSRRPASSAPSRPANGNGGSRSAPSRAPARNVPQAIDDAEDLPF